MAAPAKIDVHVHFIPPDYREAAEKLGATPAKGSFPDFSEDEALRVMDANGIATAIMSMSAPGFRFCRDASSALDLARRANDYAAELTRRRPDRFGVFACLPFFDIENGRSGDVADAVGEAIRRNLFELRREISRRSCLRAAAEGVERTLRRGPHSSHVSQGYRSL